MKITLVATPAPAQYAAECALPLGTVRRNMHKAPLTALAAWLRPEFDVAILDMQADSTTTPYGTLALGSIELEKHRVGMPFEHAVQLLVDSDVIGINSNFTHSRRIVADLVIHLKHDEPRRPVLVGGSDATADAEFYLRNGADLVVRGEGELVLRDVLRRMARGQSLDDVPNISTTTADGFAHHPTKFLREQLDVNDLPPQALDLVDLPFYSDTGEGRPPVGVESPFISIETSRGCAQACSFCATPTTKGRFRYMDLDVVEAHFGAYWDAGVRTLLFQEDNLLSRVHLDRRAGSSEGRDNLLAVFRVARDMGFAWEFTNGLEFGQFETDGTIDHELIGAMFWRSECAGRVMGAYRVTLPLENVLDEGPKLFRKLKDAPRSWPVIAALADTGVDMMTFNVIVGRPTDDERSFRTTYERCRALRELVEQRSSATGIYFNVYILSLLPGTADFRHYQHLLAYDLDKDSEVVTFYLGSLNGEHFTPEAMTRARGSLTSALNDDSLIGDFDENCYLTDPEYDRWFS